MWMHVVLIGKSLLHEFTTHVSDILQLVDIGLLHGTNVYQMRRCKICRQHLTRDKGKKRKRKKREKEREREVHISFVIKHVHVMANYHSG